MPSGTVAGQMMYWNGSSWVNVSPGSYGQGLVFCDGVPTWGGCSPKVTSTAASAVSYTTATSGGNVTAEGGASVTARGVCWSTALNPTIALTTKTVNGTGTGAFTSSITGLTTNTLYHVRAYATNSVGTSYGADVTFTTLRSAIPTITTTAISSISYTTATSGGNITNDNGATITARGVCWSTSANPTIALTTKTNNGTGTGAFTSSITGLAPNTLYHVRAYATNSVGTSYGADLTFITLPTVIPTVTTTAISGSLNTTATSGGNITSDGGATITARGICWSTTANPTIALSTKTNNGTGTGVFTSNITGLIENTLYYVRAYATNSAGTAYGTQVSFTTSSAYIGKWAYQYLRDSIYNWNQFNNNVLQLDSVRVLDYRTTIGYYQFNNNNTFTWQTATAGTLYNGSFKAVNNTGYGYGTTLKCLGISTLPAPNDTTNLYIYKLNGPNMVINRDFSLVVGPGTSDTFVISRYYELLKYDVDIPSISIGSQTWSSKNLDVAKYRNGDPIPQVTDATQWANLTTGAWCWYNNDSATYAATYGRLYNWYAVKDVRGLAPLGWHIPSDGEWNKLVKYLDAGADTTCSFCSQSSIAGGAMKSTTAWNAPNTGATNSSGFAGLPGGYSYFGSFENIGNLGGWWSSNEFISSTAGVRFLSFNNSDVGRDINPKNLGYSVRCVRD
jgi:uncharacterized protein (TIGR02145 family)